MELLQLRYFCTVAHYQSVTRAAAELMISQPALSKSLRNLETELGVKLFDRTGRGIQLNSTGNYFYREVVSALSGLCLLYTSSVCPHLP